MKKTLLIAGALLALSASLASAAGINLSWNDCGLAGSATKAFACNTNTGASTMYGSFIPPAGMTALNGNEMVVDLQSGGAVLPQWWALNAAGCTGRTSALSPNFNFAAGPFSCVDFWAGQASGGSDYAIGFGAPNRARLRLVCAVAASNQGPVDENTEYYSFGVTITNARTVGTGLCAGCQDGVCIVLNSIKLTQPAELAFDATLSNPIDSQSIVWQPASVTAPPPCPAATPAHSSSWGSIKSLYR